MTSEFDDLSIAFRSLRRRWLAAGYRMNYKTVKRWWKWKWGVSIVLPAVDGQKVTDSR